MTKPKQNRNGYVVKSLNGLYQEYTPWINITHKASEESLFIYEPTDKKSSMFTGELSIKQLLDLPLEDVPLYINDPALRKVADYRLRVGH